MIQYSKNFQPTTKLNQSFSEWIGTHAHSLPYDGMHVPAFPASNRRTVALACCCDGERCPPCPAARRSMCRCPSHARRDHVAAAHVPGIPSSRRWPFARRAGGRERTYKNIASIPVSGTPARRTPHAFMRFTVSPYPRPIPVVAVADPETDHRREGGAK